jgi:hypothetical protein
MYGLLFVVAFALILGIAQSLGWTRDSRERVDEPGEPVVGHPEETDFRSGALGAR